MPHSLFTEEPGFFCFSHVEQKADATWHGWVNFERKADHDAKLQLIPAMRHAVKGVYASERDAVAACAAYAHAAVADGETGL